MKKCSKVLCCIVSLVVLNFSLAGSRKVIRSRDPFYLEEKKRLKKTDKDDKGLMQNSKQILLEGIIGVGEKLAAVLSDGQESSVVVAGDHIDGYLVEVVDSKAVVLTRGKKAKKLELD